MSDDYNVLWVDFTITIDTAIETTVDEFVRMAANELGVDESQVEFERAYRDIPGQTLGMPMKHHTVIEGAYHTE